MHKLFLIVTSLVLATNLTLAAGKQSDRNKASTSTETVSTHSGSGTFLTAGFAIPMLIDSGETGFGFSWGVLTQTEASNHLYVGADLGLHFWGKMLSVGLSSGSNSVTGIQLTPTAIYTLGSHSRFVPYVGISAGPYIYVNALDGIDTGSRVDFTLAFRPGINWQLSKQLELNGEAKFGSLGGVFIINPTLSLNILL